MPADKPFVWLAGKGRYCVKCSTSASGCITRFDNMLEKGLAKQAAELHQKLVYLERRTAELQKEISETDPYAPDIRYMCNRLKKLDKKLGIEGVHGNIK